MILAKSAHNGALSLYDHTQQVMEAIAVFAKCYNFDFDQDLARKGAMLHDIGKAHPHFQRKIKGIVAESLKEKSDWNYAHRHELSSLAFLPLFPKEEWDTLIDLVVAHHKSIENDPTERGVLDLDQNNDEWIEDHLYDWDTWKKPAFDIFERFGIKTFDINLEQATSALEYVVEYCESKKYGWSPLRGLLKSADHFASAFMFDSKKQLENLFEKPTLDFYFDQKRVSEIYALSKISVEDDRSHTMVVAPTGAGKTDFLLKRTKGRIFYTLPFQASINAMWQRLKETVPNKDLRLLHATSRIVANNRQDEQILQPMPGSCIKVMTPHQLAAIIFGTSGFETMMLDVEGADIILDEIHTYSDHSQTMVLEIVKALLHLNCRIHIGTATMPTVLYEKLLEIMGGKDKVYEVKLKNEILDTFDRHQIYKNEDSEIEKILDEAISQQEKVLLICNTVRRAQEEYKKLEERYPNVPKMLIHSRFKRGQRVHLEKKLTEEFNTMSEACIVVSTQVVEVSLDISFDRMITQAAPLDSLVQRFGRVNRKRNKDTIGKYKPIHVLKPKGNQLPYKKEIIEASFDQLPDNGEVLQERFVQERIDKVYPNIDITAIDVHLIYRNDMYQIKELCNHKRAVIVDALEINSACCILESDRDAYHEANWADRVHLEIPIGFSTIYRHKDQYEQLEIGSYPFVIPQEREEHNIYGLELVEHNNII